MRCKNCGWENPDNLTRCEKCNTPLENVAAYAESSAHQYYGKTVSEAEVFPTSNEPKSNVCPQCGYPMRPGVNACPNCHYGVTEAENQVHPVAAKSNTPSAQGTVNPWQQVAPANKCFFEPLTIDSIDSPATLHLKGDAHELNRANLDPENPTITSKIQACVTCENGQWYIEDKSGLHTTFIYVGAKTILKDGDIVLMGNRQFVFHIER